jgi:hypothetical protein
MFVRFRQSRRRLQCSLIETRRVDGKVRHEHIAGLGTIEIPPSIADRIAFWAALHERLNKLSNRIGTETHGKLIGQIHARIPIPTVDEQRQLQKENAEADERFWSTLHNMNDSTAGGHKDVITTAQRAVANNEAAAADAAANVERVKERLAKIERDEDVTGGLGKPVDYETALLNAGFTKRELRDMQHLAELFAELESRGLVDEFQKMFHQLREANCRHAEREAERAVLRKHGLVWRD